MTKASGGQVAQTDFRLLLVEFLMLFQFLISGFFEKECAGNLNRELGQSLCSFSGGFLLIAKRPVVHWY